MALELLIAIIWSSVINRVLGEERTKLNIRVHTHIHGRLTHPPLLPSTPNRCVRITLIVLPYLCIVSPVIAYELHSRRLDLNFGGNCSRSWIGISIDTYVFPIWSIINLLSRGGGGPDRLLRVSPIIDAGINTAWRDVSRWRMTMSDIRARDKTRRLGKKSANRRFNTQPNVCAGLSRAF